MTRVKWFFFFSYFWIKDSLRSHFCHHAKTVPLRSQDFHVIFYWDEINLYYSLGKFSRWQIDILLFFPRKQDLTVHANCLHWNVKFCFLGKISETFQNVCMLKYNVLPRVPSFKMKGQYQKQFNCGRAVIKFTMSSVQIIDKLLKKSTVISP